MGALNWSSHELATKVEVSADTVLRGAIFLHDDDEPHVAVFNEAQRQNQRFISVRIRDGERGPSTLNQSVAWVSVWNVQHKVDSPGRSEIICSIDIDKLHGRAAPTRAAPESAGVGS
jgi:hypothetical protein